MPLKTRSCGASPSDASGSDGPSSAIADGGGRYLRLDGLQRANALLLAVLVSVGFGATSAEVLGASLVQTAQLAAAVLGVAHVAIAAYGAFAASQAKDESQTRLISCTKLLSGSWNM